VKHLSFFYIPTLSAAAEKSVVPEPSSAPIGVLVTVVEPSALVVVVSR
jgi:hypothetical protein